MDTTEYDRTLAYEHNEWLNQEKNKLARMKQLITKWTSVPLDVELDE